MIVTPFELACEKTGIDPTILPIVDGLPETVGKRLIADYKLGVIEVATNGKWEADFSDFNQLKYTPWFDWSPSAGAFVYTHTNCTRTNANLGARFWFETPDAARKFAIENIDLINDLHRKK